MSLLDILGSTPIASQAKRLSTLQRELDGIRDDGLKQRRFDELPERDQRMLDALWGQLFSDRGRKNIPTSGGRWTGEPGDSLWIPDDNVIPPDKGYSNMHGKTWRQIKAENGFRGIDFNDGRADFRPVSKAEVVLKLVYIQWQRIWAKVSGKSRISRKARIWFGTRSRTARRSASSSVKSTTTSVTSAGSQCWPLSQGNNHFLSGKV